MKQALRDALINNIVIYYQDALLTALVNGLTLLGLSQFYQPLAVGIVVVLAALLTRFQK